MDYTTADLMARMPGSQGMTERERRRLMNKERAGLGLLDTEVRMLENDVERRRAVADPIGSGLAEVSGVPSIMRGVDSIQRGMDEGDVLRGLGGAGQVAMGVMPGASLTSGGARAIGALYGSIPRATATGTALTLPMAMADSAEAQSAKARQQAPQQPQPAPTAADPLAEMVKGNPGLEARYRLLMQKEAASTASIPGVNRASSDAVRARASEEATQIRRDLMETIDKEQAAKRNAATVEENRNKSVREIYSDYMPYLPVAAGIAGGVGGGVIKGLYGRAYNAKTGQASESWRKAVDAKDPYAAQAAQAEMMALRAQGPGGTKPAIAFGATVGGEAALLPDEVDYARALPGSKLESEVWQRVTDPVAVAKRVGIGALTGAAPSLSASELVGAVAGRRPAPGYAAETASLMAPYTQKGTADLGALSRYQSASNALDMQKVKDAGLLSIAKEDALGLLSAAQHKNQTAVEVQRLSGASRQLDAGARPAVGASAAQGAGPSGPTGPIPAQPRLAPAPGSSGNPALPAPVKEPRDWANLWSEPARATVRDYIKSNPNIPLSSLTAPQLLAGIKARLPEGSRLPAESTVRGYLKNLREATGDKTSIATVRKTFAGDPGRSLFAIPAIGAGLGLLSGSDQ